MAAKLKEIAGLALMPGLRAAERILPPAGLRLLLWPAGAFSAARDCLHRQQIIAWQARLPASIPPGLETFRAFWDSRLNFHLSRLLNFWPDRFSSAPWQNRFHCPQLSRLQAAQARKQPVVLACLHYGPLHLLGYWLRSQGIAAAILIGGERARRSPVKVRKDNLIPCGNIPAVFYREELAEAREFLASGGCLIVATDSHTGKLITLPLENREYLMATGAIRLAAATGAELIPCAIAETSPWRFVIHTGSPVPSDALQRKPALERAGHHLLHEQLKIVRQKPEQCQWAMLAAFLPAKKTTEVTAVP